jgi:succinate dehydrogenase / fumarate reductase flavoprotein subunit
MWDHVGMSRNSEGLTKAKKMIKDIREDFWKNVKIVGTNEEINQSLEKAARVADFLELGELIAEDALQRKESCGGHFREESQTEENEAKRDDENFTHVAAWEYSGDDKPEVLHKEQLQFEFVKPSQRSYK